MINSEADFISSTEGIYYQVDENVQFDDYLSNIITDGNTAVAQIVSVRMKASGAPVENISVPCSVSRPYDAATGEYGVDEEGDKYILLTGVFDDKMVVFRVTAVGGTSLAWNKNIFPVTPPSQIEGNWAYKIFPDNTFEAWFRQTGLSYAITETSGGWYRSEPMSLAAPQALYDAYDLDIAFATVQVGHNNYPVTCSSPTFYATGVNFYVLSGNTRPQASNYTLTCYMRGALTPKA